MCCKQEKNQIDLIRCFESANSRSSQITMQRTRYNVQSPEGIENLKILGDAISLMRNLPSSDPHSWAYQAGIHGTTDPSLKGLPFIDSCPHYGQADIDTKKFFLIWHRYYLNYFEEAVRAVTGKESFTLPYWNAIDQRALPIPFLSEANGGIKGLFDDTRRSGNDPQTNINWDPYEEYLDIAYEQLREDGKADYYVFNNTIDILPHGIVHYAVGGNMASFATAALDPIFWVHHANIDRLWVEYGMDAVDPEGISKLQAGFTIGFFDRAREPVVYTYEEAAERIYEYDYNYDSETMPFKPISIEAADASPRFVQRVNAPLSDLENGDIVVNWSAVNKQSQDKRTVLSVTIEASHELSGVIDIFYADHLTGPRDRIPEQDRPFAVLADRNDGKFLDRYYVGSIYFVPHGMINSSNAMHNDVTGMSPHGTFEEKIEQVYYFDISNELRQSIFGRQDDLLHFNIDPTQPDAKALGNVLIKSIGLAYA